MSIEYRSLIKFRPMKAASPESDEDVMKLTWPMIASPKIDGIRCVVHPTLGAVTNTLLPIPNRYVREALNLYPFLDGELVVGPKSDPKVFNRTQSGIMSQSGMPDFQFLVFDHFAYDLGYLDRLKILDMWPDQPNTIPEIRILERKLVTNYAEVIQYEEEMLAQGFEGIMLRSQTGRYKFGRSTLREQGLVKLKRFKDAEAMIIGWEPLLRNMNDPTINNLGLQRRGYSKDGKFADDSMVGKFLVVGTSEPWVGVEFAVGSGITDSERILFREQLKKYAGVAPYETYRYSIATAPSWPTDTPLGRTITFKYQPHGSLEAPRSPIWKGFRND